MGITLPPTNDIVRAACDVDIQLTAHPGDAATIFALACKLEHEGIVTKCADRERLGGLLLPKRAIVINGRKASVRIENAFWCP